MFKLIEHPRGPRLYLFGKRVHHGSFGLFFSLCCFRFKRTRLLSLIGVLLVAHDIKDFPWTDRNNH